MQSCSSSLLLSSIQKRPHQHPLHPLSQLLPQPFEYLTWSPIAFLPRQHLSIWGLICQIGACRVLRFSKHSCCTLCCCCFCSCICKLSLDFRVSPSSASGIGLQPVDLKVFRVSLLKLQFKILHVHVHVSQAKHSAKYVCVCVFVSPPLARLPQLVPTCSASSWFTYAATTAGHKNKPPSVARC